MVNRTKNPESDQYCQFPEGFPKLTLTELTKLS